MPNPSLIIQLKSQSIDFFQNLAEPLAQNKAPFDPLTHKEFLYGDKKTIKEFCEERRKEIAAFESELPGGEIANFNLDLDFDLVLDENQKISLFEYLEYYKGTELTKEQSLHLKMLCQKALELFTLTEDSLNPLLLERPINLNLVKDEFVPYTPTTLSSSRLPYYVVKASVRIMHRLGTMEAKEVTSTKDLIEVIKEPLTAEKKANYIKITDDFFKNDEQFEPLTKPTKIEDGMLQLLNLFDTVRICISTLVENGDYFTSQRVAVLLHQRIDKILEAQRHSTKGKNKNNTTRKIIAFLQENQLFALKEIAYCYFKRNNLLEAVYYGKMATALASKYSYGNWPQIFGTFQDAVKVLYKIKIKNIRGADILVRNLINKITEGLQKYPQKSIYHLDIVIKACDELAKNYFCPQNYEQSLYFYQQKLTLPGVPLQEQQNTLNKINFLKAKIHSQALVNCLNSHSKFFQNICLNKNTITFNCENQEIFEQLQLLLAEKLPTEGEIANDQIKLINLEKITIQKLQALLIQLKKELKPKSQPSSIEAPIPFIESSTKILTTMTAANSATPQETKKNLPPATKKSKRSNQALVKRNQGGLFNASSRTNLSKRPPAAEISWGDLTYRENDENCKIHALQKGPYIPQGYWFGYLDEEALQHIDTNTLQALENVLKKGAFRAHHEGIKPLTEEERGDSNYEYKIRLLGANGRGDIRAYGYVKDTAVNGKVCKLITFSHVDLRAHKKHKLPNCYGILTNNM